MHQPDCPLFNQEGEGRKRKQTLARLITDQLPRTKKQFENPEARRKLSDGKGQNKPFDVFTIDGTLIGTFTYQFEAREYLKKEHGIATNIKISCVLAGKRNNSLGFLFKYKTI